MKKFFVSKSDLHRVAFIEKAVKKVKPTSMYILCEKQREAVYSGFKEAVILPLKELNKAENWITFTSTFDDGSLLVIDNVLKFVFFGDGKKKYLKSISQSFKNVIVTDVVPFYTEPAEIFYPFWFLGKSILGYDTYSSFKANHLEEKADGGIDFSHSFSVLKSKIQRYYVQDYANFFDSLQVVNFEMSASEQERYEREKEKASRNFSNPIKLYSDVSESINLMDSRYTATKKLVGSLLTGVLDGGEKIAVVNNSSSYAARHRKRLGNLNFLTFHDAPEKFEAYDAVVFMQLPVVKPYSLFYILCNQCKFYQLHLLNNKLEQYFFNKLYHHELRRQFDGFFYNEDVR
jgi:hypothetical protein